MLPVVIIAMVLFAVHRFARDTRIAMQNWAPFLPLTFPARLLIIKKRNNYQLAHSGNSIPHRDEKARPVEGSVEESHNCGRRNAATQNKHDVFSAQSQNDDQNVRQNLQLFFTCDRGGVDRQPPPVLQIYQGYDDDCGQGDYDIGPELVFHLTAHGAGGGDGGVRNE